MPAPRKPDRPRQPKPVEEVRKRLEPKGPKRWGKVARQGAGTMKGEDESTASGAWRDAMKKAREREKPPVRDETRWVEDKPRRRTKKRTTTDGARDARI